MERIEVYDVRACDNPPDVTMDDPPPVAGPRWTDRSARHNDGVGLADLAALDATLRGYEGHQYHQLAAHVADLFVAAATVVGRSTPDRIEVGSFDDRLPHLCREHVRAAAFLLAYLTGLDPTDPASALDVGHRWIERIFSSD